MEGEGLIVSDSALRSVLGCTGAGSGGSVAKVPAVPIGEESNVASCCRADFTGLGLAETPSLGRL
jgi:hypothetical protein